MSRFTRRRFLAATGIAAAAGAARQLTGPTSAQAAPLKLELEKGAVLRVLRWKRFVQGDEELFMANTRRYTQLTGVEVKVKDYIRFMMEREQYEPWQRACIGYVSHPLRAYDSNPVWTEDPQHLFFRDVVRKGRHTGYAGRLGKESAGVLADFIIVDMFAEVCTGQQTPKEAVQRAEKRARRHYRT